MSELQPLLDLLGGKISWLATALAWIGALRLVAKPVSAWVQSAFSKLVAKTIETPEVDDDALVAKLISSWPYRVLSFLVDWIASVKLPTTETLQTAAAARKGTPPIVVALLCAILAIGAGGCFSGCGSAPVTREARVFYSYKDTWSITRAAYGGWCERVVAGKVSKASERKVDAAWNSYRLAFKVSFQAAQNDWNAMTDANLDALRLELLRLIRTL